MATDHYSTLGVPKDASTQDIKRAFRRIARECHPDVAGDDPVAAERFKGAREAYETLMDPTSRGRYDRRGQRMRHEGGSFFEAMWKRTGEAQKARQSAAEATGARVRGAPAGSNLGLDDLLDGFGGGRSRRPRPGDGGRGPRPQPGEDVAIEIDVPETVAREGGAVSCSYFRLRRSESWSPGDADPGLIRVEDLAQIRVLPGTLSGSQLVEKGLGNAGAFGGPAGDLLVTLRVVAGSRVPAAEPDRDEPLEVVDVGLVEALLGGRVRVRTPAGEVWVTIAPGTHSHTTLRIRGKGRFGDDGERMDHVVGVRLVVPDGLDDESRSLIQRFAELNPTLPE